LKTRERERDKKKKKKKKKKGGGKSEKLAALKVPRQCPLILQVKVGW
jgi:hypothetical protein